MGQEYQVFKIYSYCLSFLDLGDIIRLCQDSKATGIPNPPIIGAIESGPANLISNTIELAHSLTGVGNGFKSEQMY